MADAIDLSRLPPPSAVEPLDYETILAALLADLRARLPEFTAELESDPAYKILEVAAYRELLLRQRVNDGARAVMLAYAAGDDLENLAALLGVTRQVVDPGDPDATPPVGPTYETDERLRARTQSALSAISTAGPAAAYRHHALSADTRVLDVAVTSPNPGDVTVTILSSDGNGTADADLLAAVTAALNAESVRPLGDRVTVAAAGIVEYEVTATLTIGSGPDSSEVLGAAQLAVREYTLDARRIGRAAPLSAIYAALHRPGVEAVALTAPAADVAVAAAEASYCTAITVTAR